MPAEREIGFLAKRWKLTNDEKEKYPNIYGTMDSFMRASRYADIARGSNRRTRYEEVTGQTPDISEWLDFEFYNLVWWLDRPTKPNFTDHSRRSSPLAWHFTPSWIRLELLAHYRER